MPYRCAVIARLRYLAYASLLFCCPLYAHLPEFYGREFIRVEPQNYQPQMSPENSRQRRSTLADRAETQAQVRTAEAAEGAYGPGIADPLTNLAELQLERGDTDDAVASLQRAIQLVRVNDGLYSESQLALLRRLIDIYRANGLYSELGDTYVHYYQVIINGKQSVTAESLPGLLQYLDWERQLYNTLENGQQRIHLLRAYKSNKLLLEQADDAAPSVFLSLAMSQLKNLYLILGERSLPGLGRDLPRVEQQLATIQRVAESSGRRLLKECLARMRDAPPEQLARVHLEQGDWLLWNGRHQSALRQYSQARALMQAANASEELASWFDEPVELPDEGDLWASLHEHNSRVLVVIEASFEVSYKGEARKVKVTATAEGQDWQASRIKRMLRESHFRPRISNNGYETGPRVTRHYRLIGIN